MCMTKIYATFKRTDDQKAVVYLDIVDCMGGIESEIMEITGNNRDPIIDIANARLDTMASARNAIATMCVARK